MCGISGLFAFNSKPPASELEAMNEALGHRGPDDEGIYTDGPVGLGHQRLSIIDLVSGRQPIFNEDKSVAVVFNGEIYNYRKLREMLSAKGHSFRSETDTEVIVHLYEEQGPAFVEQLQGMFAFALWDGSKERLLLARDPMGIKPLVLGVNGTRVAFASEIPAVLASTFDHGGLDEQALAKYFAFGFIPAPHTAFTNVSRLHPGEMAIVKDSGVSRDVYHTPAVDPSPFSFDTAVARIREHVEHAVERRLQSDVPLGAFLSGGIDSSVIVGVLSNHLDEPVRTFTIGFEADLFDESWAGREVATHFNTDHTEFVVTPDDVRETIPTVLGRLGEPFGDPSLIPTYLVARETSRDVKVALSGDGADELFAGYDRYRGEFLSRYYRLLPRSLRASLIEPVVGRFSSSRGDAVGELARKSKKFTRGGNPNRSVRHFEWMRIPHEQAADSVEPNPIGIGRTELADQHESVVEWLPDSRCDDLGEIQAVDVRYTLPNQMLQKVDTASMFNSLEVRVPFLDLDIVECTLGLPTSYKMTLRERKRVLKRAFEDLLPRAILNRNKQGFDMPVGEWFKDELADEFHETVAGLDTPMLDVDGVMSIYADHIEGRHEHGKFLWLTYVFATWLRRMRAEDILSEPA